MRTGTVVLPQIVIVCLFLFVAAPVSAESSVTNDDLWAKANQLYHDGEHSEALKLYDSYYRSMFAGGEVTNTSERCGAAVSRIGQCFFHTGEFEESKQWFQYLLSWYKPDNKFYISAKHWIKEADNELRPTQATAIIKPKTEDERRAKALWLDGRVQFGCREYAQSRITLLRIADEYAGCGAIIMEANPILVQAHMMTGNRDDAIDLAKSIAADTRYSVKRRADMSFWLGICYLYGPDDAQGEAYLAKTIAEYPGTHAASEARLHRALKRIHASRYAEALLDIQGIEPVWTKTYAMGEYYYSQLDYENAVEQYEKCYSSVPRPFRGPTTVPVGALTRLEECYKKLGDEERAKEARESLAKFKSGLE